jgi:hypothetical protein
MPRPAVTGTREDAPDRQGLHLRRPRLVARQGALGSRGRGRPPGCLPLRIAPQADALFETNGAFQWHELFGVTTYRLTLRTPQGERFTFDVAASEACRNHICSRTAAQLGRRLIGRAHWWDIQAPGSGFVSCGEKKFYVNQTMAPGACGSEGQCSGVCTEGISPCDTPCRLPAGYPTDCGGYHWGEGGPSCNEDYTCQSCSSRGGTCAEACAVGEEISVGRFSDCAMEECCVPANPTFTCLSYAGSREWQCADSASACPGGMEGGADHRLRRCAVSVARLRAYQGGEICSQEPCPDGYRPLTPTAECPSCCDQYPADSCLWAQDGDFCSTTYSAPMATTISARPRTVTGPAASRGRSSCRAAGAARAPATVPAATCACPWRPAMRRAERSTIPRDVQLGARQRRNLQLDHDVPDV